MNLVIADATLGNDSALAMALFDLLRNTRELEYMAHQFHWNIVGVKFNTMHEFYEEEYKQLFEDQDEIAEQIRQQGFFVPAINNVVLEENYSASGFEEQLINYSGKLAQNIALIDKVNDLAKNEIAVQDLCARLRGLRGLSLNLKVRAMLGGNKMSLEPSEATASATDLVISEGDEKELKKLGFEVHHNEEAGEDDTVIRYNDDGTIDMIDRKNGRIRLLTASGKRALMASKYKGKKFNNIEQVIKYLKTTNSFVQNTKATADAVTAGFDKGHYKEIDEESKFFKILKNDCDIRAKNFYAINKGLRLAIKVIKGTFEDASIRFFALKNKGGYVRVELKDKVYIVGYTIYESGKIKVWTRELKSNVPVNSFDYDMLNMYAKPFGTKMITGMLPTWMSI